MKTILPASQKNNNLFIGVLSGTSMDSINTILMDFSNNNSTIIATNKYPFNRHLTKNILQIINSKHCTLPELGLLDRKLGILFAKAINKLLTKANIKASDITAIGSHGQNIWHSSQNKANFTMQIADPNIICANCNITTIADFRRKDIAYGGQGAPLAPYFHKKIFSSSNQTRAIINIGGISNITVLPKQNSQDVIGFDIGPGNCLMDEWVQTKFKSLNIKYDINSRLATKGKIIKPLLEICLKDPYFKKPYPKSTGREYFNLNWLNQKILLTKIKRYNNLDILATLLELTVVTISNQIKILNLNKHKYGIEEIYLCGGGANNKTLLLLLQNKINCKVATTKDLGFHPDWVEAALFAWLAKQTINLTPGNLPSVTGAKTPAILGGIYFK
jgi:anhydro-N-acetylmuramic acid kinase